MTKSEAQKKREKGLSYLCDTKSVPRHHFTSKELNVILIQDEKDDEYEMPPLETEGATP